jgi:Amt family ammonium transporter
MFLNGRLAGYGTLVSVLCVVVFAAETAGAQNASPSASPVVSASPSATPVGPDSTATANNGGTGIDLTWPAPAKADPKTNLSTGEPTIDDAGKTTIGANSELVKNVAHNKLSINVVWTLVTGFLVMFMQAGFALVETGLCRAKSAAHTMSMNFMIYGLGMLGFWICGFAIMFGGFGVAPGAIGGQPALGQGITLLNTEVSIPIFGKSFGILGGKGFFLGNDVFDTAIFALFLFQMVFMDTTATIPTGAMAERWNYKNFMLYGFWVGMFPYAIFGNWVWGGGWLAQLGINFGLGHGHVDFAGSSVVHQTGGMIALAGAWVIGARLGKFGPDGKPRPIPGHDIPMVMLGTFILAFGWFGFNPGSTLAGTDNRIAVVAVNTMLASASGALFAALFMMFKTGKPDPAMMCNGMLAGLVAITAPCAFVNSLGAVIIGAVAGVLVCFSVYFVEGVLKLDDPVGAISVHGACGSWGVLSVGLLANGSYGQGWGGVHKLIKDGAMQIIVNDGGAETVAKFNKLLSDGWNDQGVTGVLGPLFGGAYSDWGQLGAEFTGTLTNFIFVTLFALVWFKVSNLIIPLRSTAEAEVAGLDLPEMGAEAYPDFQLTDKSSPDVAVSGSKEPILTK